MCSDYATDWQSQDDYAGRRCGLPEAKPSRLALSERKAVFPDEHAFDYKFSRE